LKKEKVAKRCILQCKALTQTLNTICFMPCTYNPLRLLQKKEAERPTHLQASTQGDFPGLPGIRAQLPGR
jgi:hypothetical protein